MLHNKVKISSTNEDIDDILLINYIKNSFDIIVTCLLEEKANIYNEERDNKRQDYETLLIKYEADIREHIKIEHQMKLYIETLETEKEELKYKIKLKKEKIEQLSQKLSNAKMTDGDQSLITIKQEETSLMNSSQDTKTENESTTNLGRFRRFEEEISNLKKNLQNYLEQNQNLSNNLKILKEQYTNKVDEIKELENKYKKENKMLKKQLLLSENKIKQLTEINSNYNYKNMQSKKNIFKANKSNNSIQIFNDLESNNSMYKISSKEKDDISFLLNKTTSIRKRQGNSLSAASSIDKIEKYLKRKYSTLKSQKTQRTSSKLKLKKRVKNNSMLINKKKTEDLMRLYLNDSNHQNLTDRIRSSRIMQKSDDNIEYYNQYCKNKTKIDKKNSFKEKVSSNAKKKTKANLKKSCFKNNLFEMINNINNINIFANNIKQNNNTYYKCNHNNSSFCNDILKQYNNNGYNLHHKKK